MHAKVPKGNMGYDQHTITVPDTVAVEPTFVAFFSTGKHKYMASLAFFQISLKSSVQNYPQYLSGLSRALFPTTFLEIAVYCVRQFSSRLTCKAACVCKGSSRFSQKKTFSLPIWIRVIIFLSVLLPWLAIEAANCMNGLGEELLGGEKANCPPA